MAKPAKQKARPGAAESDTGKEGKARSARTLLMAAALLSVASLGGGFVLARIAFQQDAASYEPDYVADDEGKPAEAAHDKEAKADHPAPEAGAAGEEGQGNDGVLEFGEIVTNINGFDTSGKPTQSFLKLNLVLVYRPEEGAADLMKTRQPFMRDLFTGYARSLTETDVRGMAGVLNVKAELLKRARAAAGSDLPMEILISDLIVQ
ncbi:flagellar basal body-associated FliL family protein [Antarcticimicrobium luteum]|uniref:Flagellar protein FliL n=1 Tax=Antarcticimicrobium luteum TaxID=2547397 RepID=A0A4R5VD24_9RHOB|nr:flagellar basal body-associated FliL family protein [Antarcticimicrobium luteum]TDK50193.1 flagellar basal body-associated FliL family protein [Antarcticimicrobium luteum]